MSDDVGSVGEEAVKLLAALQDWARQGQGQGQSAGGTDGETRPETGSEKGWEKGSEKGWESGDWLGAGWQELNEHLATGGQDCQYCPLCRAIALVRQTSPEVRAHLSVAASSLLQAASGMLEQRAASSKTPDPVQKIDLDEPSDDD